MGSDQEVEYLISAEMKLENAWAKDLCNVFPPTRNAEGSHMGIS
jgi:hypothetical protein